VKAGRAGLATRPAVSSPEREPLAVPIRKERGIRSPPSARIVTPDPPVKVVKNAAKGRRHDGRSRRAPSEECTEEPQQPSEACPSASRNPASVKSGMAGRLRRGELIVTADDGIGRAVALGRNRKTAAPPRSAKIGMPATAARMSPAIKATPKTVEQLGLPADPHACQNPEGGDHPQRHPR